MRSILKILLNNAVHDGKLTEKKRDILLQQMTDEVADLVLNDNYRQALSLSLSRLRTIHNSGLYQDYIKNWKCWVKSIASSSFYPMTRLFWKERRPRSDLPCQKLRCFLLTAKFISKMKYAIQSSRRPFFKHYLVSAFRNVTEIVCGIHAKTSFAPRNYCNHVK